VIRARRPARLPVVLTRPEVRAVLQRLDGAPRLMAWLLYGAGLRVLECCRLRVQDVDLASNQITDRETGQRRRHHLHESVLQRAVKDAARRAGIDKRATPHTLHHSFGWMVKRSSVRRVPIEHCRDPAGPLSSSPSMRTRRSAPACWPASPSARACGPKTCESQLLPNPSSRKCLPTSIDG
jgi:site-specific recombinase XerC